MACKDTAKRLLKCFCGCSDLTAEEVQHIYRLSTQGTLIDRQAKQMLRSYLESQRSGDKNLTEQYLDVYIKCDEYMQQEQGILTLDELDELSECGLPFHLEEELMEQIKTGDNANIKRCLMRIQGECRNEISLSDDFRGYQAALLKKLKQNQQ